jgi:hypothetical protein
MPEGATGIRVSGRLSGEDLRRLKPAMAEMLNGWPTRCTHWRGWCRETLRCSPAATLTAPGSGPPADSDERQLFAFEGQSQGA